MLQTRQVVTLQDDMIPGRLEGHTAFWHRTAAVKPLLAPHGLARFSRLGAFFDADLPAEGRLEPWMLRPDKIARRMQRWLERDGVLNGDNFHLAETSSTVPWLEAIFGCPIYYSFPHDTMWAVQPEHPAWPPERMGWRQNPWMEKLLEISAALDEACSGLYPVSTLHIRGATDILGAYLGPSEMCLAAYDDPARLDDAVLLMAEVCSGVIRAQMDVVRPFRGGFFSYFELWAPGPTTIWSQDLSTLFSPAMYRRFFLPFDRQLAQTVAYPVLHIHTSELHCLPLWTEIEGLAIEVTVDPTGVTLAQALPALSQAQQKVPLMLQVQNDDELRAAEEMLSPTGLQIVSRRPGGRPSVTQDLDLRPFRD